MRDVYFNQDLFLADLASVKFTKKMAQMTCVKFSASEKRKLEKRLHMQEYRTQKFI